MKTLRSITRISLATYDKVGYKQPRHQLGICSP